MKKYAVAAAVLLLALSTAVQANNDVSIFVNGRPINSSGFIVNDTTYVPIRAVSEAVGAKVAWDDSTQSAYVDFDEDIRTSQVISDVSESVAAIVGNYKSEYMTGGVSDYNEPTAHGSGVVIKSGGVILTNAHVVSDINNITVILYNGESYPGQVKYIDNKSDIAVVQIDKLGLKPVAFGKPEDVFAGQSVVAIGTPLSLSMRNSATKGIISGVNVTLTDAYYPLLQTDAAINGGNSGGPLVNMKGQLVGINSSKYAGVGIEGMAFSIPLETINYVLNQFEKNGKVIRPDIGVTIENSWEARIGLPTNKGVTVKMSTSDVLAKGDIINAVNGTDVHSIAEYNKVIRDTYTSGVINVRYTRNGEQMSADIIPAAE